MPISGIKGGTIMNYYTAGGAVRDLLLGRPVRDLDLLFDGSESDFIQANPQARKVRDLPCPIYLLGGYEYTPMRGGSFAADMLRRDFTCNALALAEDGRLFAHPQALGDLRDRVIRPTSPESLINDPVRLFRAARLHAALPGFSLHSECLAAMRDPAVSLHDIAPEQVGRETQKACSAAKPGNFLRDLAEAGRLLPWFAEFEGTPDIPAGPPKYHNSSVLEHMARVMDTTALLCRDDPEETRTLAVWSALCHDLGKASTPLEILPHHYEHEARGATAAAALADRLRLPNRMRAAGIKAAHLHMKAGVYPTLRSGTRVDLLMEAHAADLLRPLFLTAQADSGRRDLLEAAERDLAVILAVHLPPERRNQGAASGARLRELRCTALAEASPRLKR
jgi:tRNA nucleotidyltransferase (CCA-adding enzyme)